MIQICYKDKKRVLDTIRSGHIDAADLSFPNLIDSIVLTMKHHGFLDPLSDFLEDKRRDISDGLFSEGVMRKILAKYTSQEWVDFYNHYVQDSLLGTLGVQPGIHILDCTKIPVNLTNDNYEGSSVVKIDGETIQGYKLAVLRGVLDDSGIAEEIVFGILKTHDMEQCREMLRNTPCLRENDILINDRGVPVTGNDQLPEEYTEGRYLYPGKKEYGTLWGCRAAG